jgi:hypothetical protein
MVRLTNTNNTGGVSQPCTASCISLLCRLPSFLDAFGWHCYSIGGSKMHSGKKNAYVERRKRTVDIFYLRYGGLLYLIYRSITNLILPSISGGVRLID